MFFRPTSSMSCKFDPLGLLARVGEFHRPFKTPPRILVYAQFYPYNPKKCQKVLATGLGLEFQVYYYGSPYDQGQLTEVPLNFEIFAIKVVGQIIYACSTSKKSKLQSNGIIKLGLVNFLVLYCNLNPKKCKSPSLGQLLALKSEFFELGQTSQTI